MIWSVPMRSQRRSWLPCSQSAMPAVCRPLTQPCCPFVCYRVRQIGATARFPRIHLKQDPHDSTIACDHESLKISYLDVFQASHMTWNLLGGLVTGIRRRPARVSLMCQRIWTLVLAQVVSDLLIEVDVGMSHTLGGACRAIG
jgi:hypothetical protein